MRLPSFTAMQKIDVHVHVFDDVPEYATMLRRIHMRVVSICVGHSQPELLAPCEERARMLDRLYGPEVRHAAAFDVTELGKPGYAARATAWIDAAVASGAVMVKLWKDVGMRLRGPDGAWVLPDDPGLDPVYARLVHHGVPLMAHVADPIDAWRPLDPGSPHYTYYRDNPDWHMLGQAGAPSHAELLAARDRFVGRHPGLTVIAAHLGGSGHDLAALGRSLDRLPNLCADVSARTHELQRLPAATVRAFIERYQDRLLYATDADRYTPGREPTVAEREAFAAAMEARYRADWDYYAGAGVVERDGRRIECLHLPRRVLEKFYHGNALRLIPGLRRPAAKGARQGSEQL